MIIELPTFGALITCHGEDESLVTLWCSTCADADRLTHVLSRFAMPDDQEQRRALVYGRVPGNPPYPSHPYCIVARKAYVAAMLFYAVQDMTYTDFPAQVRASQPSQQRARYLLAVQDSAVRYTAAALPTESLLDRSRVRPVYAPKPMKPSGLDGGD